MGHLRSTSISAPGYMDETHRLDSFDVKILAALQRDGRMTHLKLADAVGLSATPCQRRVRHLEAKGYIQGYGAMLDLRRCGTCITVLTEISLRSRQRQDTQSFERYVQRVPFITECFSITGKYDYLLRFLVRDVAHYQDLMDDLQQNIPPVHHYSTVIVLQTVKQGQGFPIALLSERGSAPDAHASSSNYPWETPSRHASAKAAERMPQTTSSRS